MSKKKKISKRVLSFVLIVLLTVAAGVIFSLEFVGLMSDAQLKAASDRADAAAELLDEVTLDPGETSEGAHNILVSLESGREGRVISIDGRPAGNVSAAEIGIADAQLRGGYTGSYSWNGGSFSGKTVETESRSYGRAALICVNDVSTGALFPDISVRVLTVVIILFFVFTLCLFMYARFITTAGASRLVFTTKLTLMAVLLALIFLIANNYICMFNSMEDKIADACEGEEDLDRYLQQMAKRSSADAAFIRDYLKSCENMSSCRLEIRPSPGAAEEAVNEKILEAVGEPLIPLPKNLPENVESFNYMANALKSRYLVHLYRSKALNADLIFGYEMEDLLGLGRDASGKTTLTALAIWLLIIIIKRAKYRRALAESQASGNEVTDAIIGRLEKSGMETKELTSWLGRWRACTAEQKIKFFFKIAMVYIVLNLVSLVCGDVYSGNSLVDLITSGSWQRGFSRINISFVVIAVISVAAVFSLARDIIGVIVIPLGRKAETYIKLSLSIVQYALIFVCIFYGTYLLGMNVDSVATLATVVTGIIGIGAQKLIGDISAGFLMLAEGRLVVGDRVSAGGVTGTIKEIGIRMTVIEGDDGSVSTVSNSAMNNVTIFPPAPPEERSDP